VSEWVTEDTAVGQLPRDRACQGAWPEPGASARLRSTIPVAGLTIASAMAGMTGVTMVVTDAIRIMAGIMEAIRTTAWVPGWSQAASSERRPHIPITTILIPPTRHLSRQPLADIAQPPSGPVPWSVLLQWGLDAPAGLQEIEPAALWSDNDLRAPMGRPAGRVSGEPSERGPSRCQELQEPT
jgi:hypothetical protein